MTKLGIAAHLSGARNDTLSLSLRGTIVPKQSRGAMGLPRFARNDTPTLSLRVPRFLAYARNNFLWQCSLAYTTISTEGSHANRIYRSSHEEGKI